ncbi:MAG: hypothetical protein K2X77_13435 [Candidatus Obscuribacterales bacterium]|nr:hypothetical protein [Candidatus Obscuribacterales bacterium]
MITTIEMDFDFWEMEWDIIQVSECYDGIHYGDRWIELYSQSLETLEEIAQYNPPASEIDLEKLATRIRHLRRMEVK